MIYRLNRVGDTGYDEYRAKIIRAKSEQEARDIANQRVGDEGKIWSDAKLVTCELLSADGDSVELLSDFSAG